MQILERRKQRRLALRWHLSVSGNPPGTSRTTTENLSARGFYCILDSSPTPGTVLDCHLTVPNYGALGSASKRSIVCQAEVVRVETRGAGPGFGVACRILDFKFAKGRNPFMGI